jgi:hypothetical protein
MTPPPPPPPPPPRMLLVPLLPGVRPSPIGRPIKPLARELSAPVLAAGEGDLPEKDCSNGFGSRSSLLRDATAPARAGGRVGMTTLGAEVDAWPSVEVRGGREGGRRGPEPDERFVVDSMPLGGETVGGIGLVMSLLRESFGEADSFDGEAGWVREKEDHGSTGG